MTALWARVISGATGLALIGAATAGPLDAQVDVVAHAGFATSVSRLGTYLPSGTTADAGVAWRAGHSPLTLRLQASYTRLRANRFALGRVAEGADVWSLLALAAVDIPVHDGAKMRPYVVAGGGLQHRGSIGNLGLDYTRPAVTAGVGADYRLNGITLSGEWRIGVVGTRAGREAIMPVVLGVKLPVLGAGPPPTGSEGARPTSRSTSGPRGTIGTWLGYAPTTWSGAPLGGTPDRGLLLAGLRCTWALAGSADWRLEYAADLLPLAVMTRTKLPEPATPTRTPLGQAPRRRIRNRCAAAWHDRRAPPRRGLVAHAGHRRRHVGVRARRAASRGAEAQFPSHGRDGCRGRSLRRASGARGRTPRPRVECELRLLQPGCQLRHVVRGISAPAVMPTRDRFAGGTNPTRTPPRSPLPRAGPIPIGWGG